MPLCTGDKINLHEKAQSESDEKNHWMMMALGNIALRETKRDIFLFRLNEEKIK